MKQINLIGGTLTAVLSLSVIVACDSRGVTAMKSRRFTVEEQALAKSMRGTTPAKTVDAKTGAVVPNESPVKAPVRDEDVSEDQAGNALPKVFTEVNGSIVAKKSDLLAIADQQLGTVNEDARKLIKGITILDKSQNGQWKFDVEAVIVLNGRQQNLIMSGLEVVPESKGRKDFKLTDRFAANVANDEAPDLIVGPVCQNVEGDKCTKAVLMIQWGLKSGAGQYVVIEIAPGLSGAPSMRTNVGPIKSFTEASNAPPEDGEVKPKATLQDANPAVPATMPTKEEAKSMSFKEFSARYRAAKAATAATSPVARFPRIGRAGLPSAAPKVEAKSEAKPTLIPSGVPKTDAPRSTPQAAAKSVVPAGTDPVVYHMMLEAEAAKAKKTELARLTEIAKQAEIDKKAEIVRQAEAAKQEAARAAAEKKQAAAAASNDSWYSSLFKKVGSVAARF